VQRGSGSENSPEPHAWHEPGGGWGCTTVELALLTGSPEEPAAPGPDGWPPWRCPAAGRRCEGREFDVEVLAVAVTLAPPEGAGADGVELDVLLDAAEHPTASMEHAAALRSRAQLDTPALLTGVRLVAAPAESAVPGVGQLPSLHGG
jgi:hypothetical protein